MTVGASFLSQTIALQDSTTVKFEIWDTAGQERLVFKVKFEIWDTAGQEWFVFMKTST